MTVKTTKILCIFDGFGLSPKSKNNVPYLAKMPNFRKVLEKYWWTTLNADGESVGQEAGLVGNSEVGHMNLGGLKLIPQLSYQITKSSEQNFDLSDKSPDQLFDPKVFLKNKFTKPESSKTVHLAGLFSTGTIHSDLRHWAGAIESAGLSGAEKIVLHLFSDGRDSDRQSLIATWEYFTKTFEDRLKRFENKIFLGSLGGRFYAMDRDKNWDRVARAVLPIFSYKLTNSEDQGENINLKNFMIKKYNVDLNRILDDEKQKWESENIYSEKFEPDNFFHNLEEHFFFLKDDLEDREKLGPLQVDIKYILQNNTEKWYRKQVYDEVLYPKSFYYLPLNGKTRHFDGISKSDTVWLLNFRTDRMKQFSQMLCDINKEFELDLDILGMNDYGVDQEICLDKDLQITRQKSDVGYYPIFKNQPVENTLAKKISEMDKTQLHIAETEKYNHVTYFFNGGQNKKWEGEDWFVIDSNKVNSHAEKPAMKAIEITDYIIENGIGKYDYVIVNYASPDMLGHTGDTHASIESMEVLDKEFGRLITAVEDGNHKLILTADHGNIEFVGDYEKDGKQLIDTEHNPNLVPCVIVDKDLDTEKLSANITELVKELNSTDDLKLLISQLEKPIKTINLSNQEDWIDDTLLTQHNLPLWIAGVLLLAL